MAIERPEIVAPWAETATGNDKVKPADPYLLTGFPPSPVPPPRGFFNWVLNFCANGVRYLSKRGIADWHAGETYSPGDIQRAADGELYEVRPGTSPIVGSAPSASPTTWCKLILPTTFYGNGDDGDVTVAAGETLSLTQPKRFRSLTVAGHIATNGFPLWVRGQLLITGAGVIECDGANGNGADPGVGETPSLVANGHGGLMHWGWQGGRGQVPAISQSASDGHGSATDGCSVGGHGGDGAGDPSEAGSGGQISQVPYMSGDIIAAMRATPGCAVSGRKGAQLLTGGGGGGGGSCVAGAGYYGGAGGSGGGVVGVYARRVSVSHALAICARGGDGGAPDSNVAAHNGGGGGGGGGVFVFCDDWLGPSLAGNVAGGIGGGVQDTNKGGDGVEGLSFIILAS